METTIRINSDELDLDVLEGIKKMFPHKTIEIIVQPADATEYIVNNPDYEREITERIEVYEARGKTISIKPDELL